MFLELKANNEIKPLILKDKEELKFGIKSKVIIYPENLFVVWIQFSVVYER